MSDLEKHNILVEEVREQVKAFYLAKKPARIYHGGTNSTRPFDFKKGEVVDVSKLNNVLEINVNEQYALVEPNVRMAKLVEATLKYNLIPPVVMEFPEITVGGGIQGGAGESSSFKWGLFHNICIEYEIILGNGEIFKASPNENPDLFYGTAGSYGSLGVITSIKFKLIPAKKFVHFRYNSVHNFDEAIDLIKKCSTDGNVQYLDSIMYSENFGVVMVGKLSDEENLPVSKFLGAWDDWFYLHAKEKIKNNSVHEELIPIKDYLFRYDRGAFWMGGVALGWLKMPSIKLTRFIFNNILKAKELYGFLHSMKISQYFMVQDVSIPEERVVDFIKSTSNSWHIFPLWLCPLKPGKQDKLSPNAIKTGLVINVGVWGEVNHKFEEFIKINKDFEALLGQYGGRKTLYAHSYYSREEFWKIYDLSWYSELRKKYHAEIVFPDIYDKVNVKGKIEASVLKGIFRFFKSPFKLND
ncbi:FAD-binding oxidoreductase [Candidatus Nomurabacteria bacterium]|nr:FAD-binding oxidoreductase [Candidatus Nomurabacteria bacterium]